mgnify:CR=1 FL=1
MNETETNSEMTLQEKCQIHKAAMRKYLPEMDKQFNIDAIDCAALDAEYTRQFQSAMMASIQGDSSRLNPDMLYLTTLMSLELNSEQAVPTKKRREAWR